MQTQEDRDMAMAVGLNWPCLAIKAFVKPRFEAIDPSANCRVIYTNAEKTAAKVELDTAEGVTHGRIIADAAIKENPFDWLVVVQKVEK